MSRSSFSDKYIGPLTLEMKNVLTPMCFANATGFVWMRKWGWKRDTIRIARLEFGIIINCSVDIPCYGNGSKPGFETLLLKGLGHIIGRSRVEFRYPSLGSAARFAADVVDALHRGLPWFDDMDTPAKCMSVLQASQNRPGTPAYLAMEHYLMALPTYLNLTCCSIERTQC
jgi:hypothetical protein